MNEWRKEGMNEWRKEWSTSCFVYSITAHISWLCKEGSTLFLFHLTRPRAQIQDDLTHSIAAYTLSNFFWFTKDCHNAIRKLRNAATPALQQSGHRQSRLHSMDLWPGLKWTEETDQVRFGSMYEDDKSRISWFRLKKGITVLWKICLDCFRNWGNWWRETGNEINQFVRCMSGAAR